MPLNAKDRGYIAGICDARKDRTPAHSHTSYEFPLRGTYNEQSDYNEGYYEGKQKYTEDHELNTVPRRDAWESL